MPKMRSLGTGSMAWMIDSQLAAMLAWVSMTPLGSPVEPLENMIVAKQRPQSLIEQLGPDQHFAIFQERFHGVRINNAWPERMASREPHELTLHGPALGGAAQRGIR